MSAADDKRRAKAALLEARRNMAVLTEARATAEASLLPRFDEQIAELQLRINHLELHASQTYHSVRARRSAGNHIQSHGHSATGYR